MICPKCGFESEGSDICVSCKIPLVQEKEFENENRKFQFDKNLEYKIPLKLESSPNEKIIGKNLLPNEYFISSLRKNLLTLCWKFYFWFIVFTSVLICPAIFAPHNFYDIVNPLLYLLNVVGLYGYVFKKRIFKQNFWKLSFVVIIIWLFIIEVLIKLINIDSLQFLNDSSKAIPFSILLAADIIYLPLLYGLYKYGYNLNSFSDSIEKLKFSLKGIIIFFIKIFLSFFLFFFLFLIVEKLSLNSNVNIIQKNLTTGKTIDVETNSLLGLKLYEVELNEKGFYDGKSIYWYPFATAVEKEGHWKNGFWDGEWIFYDFNGKIKSKRIYKEGKLIECFQDINGELKKLEQRNWPGYLTQIHQTKPQKSKLLN